MLIGGVTDLVDQNPGLFVTMTREEITVSDIDLR